MSSRKFYASPVKVTGISPGDQRFESALEEDYFMLLRFRPDVRRWERNTHVVDWIDDDKQVRRYTPDVLVELNAPGTKQGFETFLVEVKPDFLPGDRRAKARLPRRETAEENERKWQAAHDFALIRGWTFRVERESAIRTTYLQNVKFLLRYKERRPAVPPPEEEKLLEVLRARKELQLGEWVALLEVTQAGKAKYWPSCYRLMIDRRVDVDLESERLTLNSRCRFVA